MAFNPTDPKAKTTRPQNTRKLLHQDRRTVHEILRVIQRRRRPRISLRLTLYPKPHSSKQRRHHTALSLKARWHPKRHSTTSRSSNPTPRALERPPQHPNGHAPPPRRNPRLPPPRRWTKPRGPPSAMPPPTSRSAPSSPPPDIQSVGTGSQERRLCDIDAAVERFVLAQGVAEGWIRWIPSPPGGWIVTLRNLGRGRDYRPSALVKRYPSARRPQVRYWD